MASAASPAGARARRAARIAFVAAVASVLLTGCGLFAAAPAPPGHGGKVASPKSPGPVEVRGNAAPTPTGLGGAFAVTVDNDPYARPQSGLSRADLVFEAPAEGGITRFLAVFWSQAAHQIGPVRSTRIYFDQLAQSYDLPLAHAGGNVDALKAIGPLHISNIDEIWTPGAAPFFYRTSARPAPHNLYTSTSLIVKAIHSLGLALGPVPAWSRGQVSGGKAASLLVIDFSGVEQARWQYAGGMYTRYEGATEDKTLAGNPIRARAVVVLFVGEAPDPDPYTPLSIKLLMTGQGKGEVAADGRLLPVVWKRTEGQPFQILAANGTTPQALPAAPVWIELVPTGTPVSTTG